MPATTEGTDAEDRTPGPPPTDRLHAFFERQADLRPDAIAVEGPGCRLSYARLDAEANRLARHLRSLGVGAGDSVALLLPRSPDVYVALLAILKAGAAYVPLDPDYPADRVSYILSDAGVRALVTTSALEARRGDYRGEVVLLDNHRDAIASAPARRIEPSEDWREGDALCYVIYTSGTTGRPKGVQVEHRAACHLVGAERDLFGVGPDDRVFQGFSIAFDASVEEVWLAFASGATLVVGTREMVHAGPDLARRLTEAGVTVLSCVPTLLSMLEDDLPAVRLLILGGETCPPHLVARWCRPGRRMVNTYGPTEATVIATSAECEPGRPVTIGLPLPGYDVRILDETMRPAPAGDAGEILIGGVALARGYVGFPELTREKFVLLAGPGGPPARFYRTGDLGRFRDDGEIEFLGRIDAQVKVRGFRVELAEIEAVLAESPEVLSAAVTLREDSAGPAQLVAYVVPRLGAEVVEERIRSRLRSRLPTYMVPALVETIAALPTLPSGKVDRKALPPPRPRRSSGRTARAEARTDVERAIAAAWGDAFAPAAVSLRDDFFRDLGGHSLLAARVVSTLRRDPRFRDLSILDVYDHPTIEALAAKFERATRGGDAETRAGAFHPATSRAHALCGLAQAIGLYFILGVFSLQWLGPYLTYSWMVGQGRPILEAVLAALATLSGVYPVMLLLSIVVKWAVIGRYRAGSYPLWGTYFLRWWFVSTLQGIVPVGYLSGTPLLNLYYRLLGAKVGADVFLASDGAGAFDLLTIGDDASIGIDAGLAGCTVEDGLLKIGPVTIGRRCFVGTRAVLREGTVMEDDAKLEDLSMLPRGTRIPRGERWSGSPARPVPGEVGAATEPIRAGRWRRLGFGVLHAAGLFLFPVFVIAAIFPGMIALNALDAGDGSHAYLLAAPLVALSFVVFLCLEIAAVKWLLLGRVAPGRYPLHGSFAYRKWFVDQLMELSLDVLGPLYATIYLAPWYRLLGARLGRRAEVSTASFISPDLLTIGDEGFIADDVSLGAARYEGGVMTVDATRIGTRAFIGNSALLPPGVAIGENCLIGCLSTPPAQAREGLEPGTSWLGSPPLFLPQRQATAAFPEEMTFLPSRALRAQRAAIEFARVTLPSTCFIVLTSLLLSAFLRLHESVSLGALVLLFPLLYAGFGVAAALIVVALKWTLMGTYRPCEKPLWSPFVWRTELVTAMQENLADLALVEMLAGTPFLCMFFRLLGARIGRRVYMETTQLTEYDLVEIGDEAALNADCTIQTHLFEDRVMKMSTIRIGARCSVGGLSLVLYDTRMDDGAALGDLSLLMKGEVLPPWTAWEGIPARVRGPGSRTVPRHLGTRPISGPTAPVG